MNPPRPQVEHNGDEGTLSSHDGWCCTEMEITHFSYTWTIKNFSFYKQKSGDHVDSAIFPSGSNGDVKWCLEMYPNGEEEQFEDFVSLFLRLAECRNNEVDAKYDLSIVDCEGKATNTRSSDEADRFIIGETWGWNKFVSREALFQPANRLLHKDSLTILCKLSVSEGKVVTVSGQNTASAVNVPNSQLSEDYGKLFESEQFCDVVFNLGGHELRAHKGILVARCPVFASMLEHEMTEKIQNRVDITDIDQEVFREMLRFVYTGQAPSIDKFPMDLLVASDKYGLERLKAMCEKSVSSQLCVKNAAEVLLFADMHNAHQLKSQAVAYTCAHALAVKKTVGWKNMIHSNPALALEISTELDLRSLSRMGSPIEQMKLKRRRRH